MSLSQAFLDRYIERAGFGDLWEKVQAGERLSYDDGVRLYESNEATAIGYMANWVRERLHGDLTYFVRNQHINYTNICNKDCKFCSFYAKKGGPKPYELDLQAVRERLHQYRDVPITEVHMVGGINPRLPYQYYLDLVRTVKEERPSATVKAFTMIELQQIARKAEKPLRDVLLELMEHGLGALPGGGAEVLTPRVHEELYKKKLDWRDWLETARIAHSVGLKSNATMLYGHIETYAHRIDHMNRLRELQDRTGGFNTFIPLKFRNKDNDMSNVPELSVVEDMKLYAVARLFMDNFPHIKAYWPMLGRKNAQLTLSFGVNDLDGTIDDTTKIYSMAGSEEQTPSLSTAQLVGLIKQVGREPVERDTLYNEIRNFKDVDLAAMELDPTLN